jgi:hypothetical protein
MRPHDVTSPQNKLSNLEVIHDNGDWAVATFDWAHTSGPRRRVGIRWNGDGDDIGNPQSSGHATWFLLSENMIAEFVEMYATRRESGEAL